jgi:hypothetical protein
LTRVLCIPGLDRLFVVSAAVVHQVFDASIVTATEGGAIFIAVRSRDRWVAVLVAIHYVGSAVIFEVFVGSFDAVAKTSMADLSILGGWGVPSDFVVIFRVRWVLGEECIGGTD